MSSRSDTRSPKTLKDYFIEIKQTGRILSWVWNQLVSEEGKKYAKRMIALIVFSCFMGVLIPTTIKLILDGVNPETRNLDIVLLGVIGYFSLILISSIVNHFSSVCRELVIGENGRRLNYWTSEEFFKKSLGQHINNRKILNEATIRKGYDRVQDIQNIFLFEGFEVLFNLILPFLALWIIDIKLGIAVTILLVVYGIWSLYLNREVMVNCIPIDELWRYLSRYRVERWLYPERVINNNKQSDEIEELKKIYNDALEPDRKFWLWFIKQISLRNFMSQVVVGLVISYGVYQVWNGQMTLGWLYPLVMWSNQLTNNLWRVAHIEQRINFATPKIEALEKAMKCEIGLEICENPEIINDKKPYKVEFKNVSYSYPKESDEKKSGQTVLKDVSFDIKEGEKVALLGPSGAGKTSILKLFLRYMDPDSGNILINGKNLKLIDSGLMKQNIGYVPQSAQVFTGTVAYNLTYDVPKHKQNLITRDNLLSVADEMQLDFAPKDSILETKVGERGLQLSGGQAQRLMIADVFIKNPLFYCFDEATSALDSTTEKIIQEALSVSLGKAGAIFIAHRFNTVQNVCNKFVFLENKDGQGSVVSAIAHSFEELAEKSDTFRIMALNQGIVLKNVHQFKEPTSKIIDLGRNNLNGFSDKLQKEAMLRITK